MKLTPNPKPFRYTLGERGEVAASQYLIKHGYTMVEKNYRCALGEIDLIARKKDRLIFIEVKTRSSHDFGRPEESVHEIKQRKIFKLAEWYLKAKKLKDEKISFDVVAVTWIESNSDPEIRHIPNAMEVRDFRS